MKNINGILLAIVIATMGNMNVSAKNQVELGAGTYDIDTLVYRHQVGPGVMYAKYHMPDRPLLVSVLEMDMTNQYVDWETCNGGDQGVYQELPSSMYQRNDREGHEMIAATNGDFFFYTNPIENGIPRSGQFKLNECVTNPVGRAAIVMDNDRNLYIDRVSFAGTVTVGETVTRLHTVNMQRLEREDTQGNQLNLYTNSYGSQTEECSGGTKVVISPKSGSFFWSANKDIVAVVDEIIDGTGVSSIPTGKAVLWGRGTSEEFLKTLSPGNEMTLNLKTDMNSNPGLLTDFKELMGGSDHIILKNGELAEVWDELHPRTCMGFTADKKTLFFVVVDGRSSESAGATISECGKIMKLMGVTDAINLDGGGSTCMIVNGDIVNRPSDGTERRVGNGNLLVSLAPKDDAIGMIGFAPRSFNVLANARITPVIYGYNKYGVLKTKNLEGVTFTCDENIGSIIDGSFVASATPGVGNLTAHYGDNITATQKVYIISCDKALRLDSVVVDDVYPYDIEVIGTNGVYSDLLDPRTFEWTVQDPSICSVEDGVIHAIKNGTTEIVGKSEGFEDVLKVTIAIPEYQVTRIPQSTNVDGWTISAAGLKNRTETVDDKGFTFNFTGSPGRSNYIKLAQKFDVSGLPYALEVKLNPGNMSLTTISLIMKSALGDAISKNVTFEAVPDQNGVTTLTYDVEELLETWDQGKFPLSFTSITFNFKALTSGEAYVFTIPEINALYRSGASAEPVRVNLIANNVTLFPNPIAAGESVTVQGVEEDGKVTVDVYDVAGVLVRKINAIAEGGTVKLSTAGLSAGNYLLSVGNNSLHLIVQ